MRRASGTGTAQLNAALIALAYLRNDFSWLWNFNAGKLRLLVSAADTKLPHRSALGAVMAWEFAFSFTPAGSGGVVSYVYLLNRYGITTAHAAAIFAMELGIDLLFSITATIIVTLKLAISVVYNIHLGSLVPGKESNKFNWLL